LISGENETNLMLFDIQYSTVRQALTKESGDTAHVT
jgi:hypothetical protein